MSVKIKIATEESIKISSFLILTLGLCSIFVGISWWFTFEACARIYFPIIIVAVGIYLLFIFSYERIFWRREKFFIIDNGLITYMKQQFLIPPVMKTIPISNITKVEIVYASEKYHKHEMDRIGKLDVILIYSKEETIAGFGYEDVGIEIEKLEKEFRRAKTKIIELSEDKFIERALKDI